MNSAHLSVQKFLYLQIAILMHMQKLKMEIQPGMLELLVMDLLQILKDHQMGLNIGPGNPQLTVMKVYILLILTMIRFLLLVIQIEISMVSQIAGLMIGIIPTSKNLFGLGICGKGHRMLMKKHSSYVMIEIIKNLNTIHFLMIHHVRDWVFRQSIDITSGRIPQQKILSF